MYTAAARQLSGKWLLAIVLLFGFAAAHAQSEPTLNEVYQAAQSGRLDQAQTMMERVLVAHPNSAKAHFVQAELFAHQGKVSAAREAFATAERLAPGLQFARPEAVSSLRSQLSTRSGLNGLSGVNSNPIGRAAGNGSSSSSSPSLQRAAPSTPAAPAFSSFWPILLIIGAIALAIVMFRKRRSESPAPAAYAGAGGTFNNGQGYPVNAGATPGAPGQPYGQGYAQPYGQAQGSGLGGRVAGGLATGLAVGAGMMAAQAIGRSMSGHDAGHAQPDNVGGGVAPDPAGNDLGGQNFGINDTSSWDDAGSSLSSSDVGGGDWDS